MSETSKQRQVKREIHGKPQELRIDAAPGWREVLIQELTKVLQSWTLSSKFNAEIQVQEHSIELLNLDFRNLIELPLRLQSAADIRWLVRRRHVGSFGDFSKMLQGIPWDLYLPDASSIQFKVASYRSKLFHEGIIANIVSESLQQKGYKVDQENGSFRIFFEQIENRHAVYLSLTKEPLYHRQYKQSQKHRAPLQEHLAGAAIHWFFQIEGNRNWQPDYCCVPFAGSGTLFAETMIHLHAIPLDHWRQRLSMEDISYFTEASLEHIRKHLGSQIHAKSRSIQSVLIEKDPEQIDGLALNLDYFLDSGRIPLTIPRPQILTQDLFDSKLPENFRNVFLPLNPPYGLRLEQGIAAGSNPIFHGFYRRLGDFLRQWSHDKQNLRGFVLVPDHESLQGFREAIGSKSVLAIQSFTQGGQHIRCVAFDLV